MAIDSNVLQEVVDALKQDPEIKNNVYQATVSRIDGEGVVWVNIAGSDTETPTAITSAEVAPGDAVNVEWRNNKLYIGGNYSNPSAGVVRVEAVEAATQVASEAAANAVQEATRARDAAEIAEGEAVRAKQAADSAERSAEDAYDYAQQAMGSARQAEKSANTALEKAELATDYANEANDYAQTALAYSNSALTFAQTAEQNATDALKYANSANSSATGALNSLGEVEKVIDALNWISEHGEYGATEDTTVQEGKWYFVRSGSSPDYVYTVVDSPTGDPHAQGWYELTGVDTAVSNYVMSHIALTDEGLSLQTDGTPTRLLLSPEDGLVIKGLGGQTLATYGQDAIIGDIYSFHIKIDGTELGFYNAAQKIAYINGNKLYITQSVVLQQMDIGERTADGGDGQWSWKVHKINNKNNLYLKWNG